MRLYALFALCVRKQFRANRHDKTKEASGPKAAQLLLWWRPKNAAVVLALHGVHIIARNTMLVLRFSKTEPTVGRAGSRFDGWLTGYSPLSRSILKMRILITQTNCQPPCCVSVDVISECVKRRMRIGLHAAVRRQAPLLLQLPI